MEDLTPNQFKIIPKRDKIQVPDTFDSGTEIGSLVGGWKTTPSELSKGKLKLQSIAERILIGDATEPLTGAGIFIGKDDTDYELRIGDPAGNYFHFDGTDVNLVGGIVDGTSTIGGRTASTLATAINADGHFIDARLDTSAKEILGDFTFGASGALQIGTYKAGVSGDIKIAPTGIVARNSSDDNTFTLNGTTGNATFGGELVSASGTFGTITAGTISGVSILGSTITGGTIQTATTGKRIRLLSASGSTPTQTANSIGLIDSSNNLIWSAGSETSIIQKIQPVEDNDMALNCQTANGLAYNVHLVEFTIWDTNSTGTVLYLTGYGTGTTQTILGVGGTALNITKHTNGAIAPAVTINQWKNDNVLDINKQGTGVGTAVDIANDGTGKSVYIYQSRTTNGSYAVDIYNKGTGKALEVWRDNGSATISMSRFINTGGGRTFEVQQTAAGNSNAMIWLANSGSGRFIDCGNGAYLSNAGTWTDACSKTLKTDFQTPNLSNIIEKIKKLKVLNYVYKADKKHKKNIRHLTPMAEDAHQLFGLGDEKGLSANDMAGLALLGVQFLLSKQK